MNCSKCGAPIDDGAVFCGECGTPVASAPAAAPVAAAPVAPAPAAAPTAQPDPTPAPQQSNFQQNLQNATSNTKQFAQNTAQNAKQAYQNVAQKVSENELVGNTVNIFKNAFSKPSQAAASVVASKNLVPGMILIAIQCVVMIILFSIHIPGISNDHLGFGNRLGYSIVRALAIAALYAVEAAGIVLKKDTTKNPTFQSALAAIGTQTVYSTCLIVLSFFFGLFASDISSQLMSLTNIVYATLSSRVIFENVEGDNDTKNITTVIIAAIAFLCMFLLNIAASKVLWA